jgi:serine/threonine protein kinase/WD40 repeat protein
MNDAAQERDPVERLAEEFLVRYRRGERPAVSEFTGRHPDLADEICKLFPALVALEELGSTAEPSPLLRPGAVAVPPQLGEYRILQEVGRGGMGIVYEAVQESLGRHVALKVLAYPGLVSPMHLQRFRREARAVARLHHTNIVPVFGVGTAGGLHYYAMQFIQGQGLDVVLSEVGRLRGKAAAGSEASAAARSAAKSLCDGRFLPSSEATAPSLQDAATVASRSRADLAGQPEVQYFRSAALLGVQAAEALAYAHRQGVLHRDIKPSNLLLDAQGTLWITDFGLAKVEDNDVLTHTGDLVGTLRYMAPERLRGVSDPRGDVYSLGLTLYEMLTLRPAFTDTDRPRLIERIAREEPPRPRQIDRRIPRDLETIVLKATAKEPAARYASAGTLAEDLRRFLADRPIQARRASLLERSWRWCRRNPRLALPSSLAVALAAVVVGALIQVALLGQRVHTADDALRERERTAGNVRFEALLAKARLSQRLGALSAIDEARELLPRRRPQSESALKLRNACIAALGAADLQAAQDWEAMPGSGGTAYCARAGLFAQADAAGEIRIRQAEDDRQVARLPGPNFPACTLIFSADGRYLAAEYCRSPTSHLLWVWNCARKEVVLDVPFEVNGQPDISSDGRWLAVPRADGRVALCDLEDPVRPRRDLPAGERPQYGYVAFHPAGRQLAISRAEGVVQVWDLEAEPAKVCARLPHRREARGLAWSPDGQLLAVSIGMVIQLWRWRDGACEQAGDLTGHTGEVRELAFSRGGDLLASKGYDNMVRLWEVPSRRPLAQCPIVYHLSTHAQLQFDHDDRRLGIARDANRLFLFEVHRGRECRALAVDRGGYSELGRAFSPDGRLLAAAVLDGIYLWDWAADTPPAFLRHEECWSVCFTPDGRELLTSGRKGLHRRPLDPLPAGDGPRAGEQPALWRASPLEYSCFTPDGRYLAARLAEDRQFADRAAVVLDVQKPDLPEIRIHGQPQLEYVALSPEGKWLATGTRLAREVHLWRADTGEHVQVLPIETPAAPFFSPDGRWLVLSTGSAYQFLETATWRLSHQIAVHEAEPNPGDVAFTADGSLTVVRLAPTRVGLFHAATGRPLAEFQPPDQQRVFWHCLSPDGGALAVRTNGMVIYVWDLRLIRQRLKERGLDWEPTSARITW